MRRSWREIPFVLLRLKSFSAASARRARIPGSKSSFSSASKGPTVARAAPMAASVSIPAFLLTKDRGMKTPVSDSNGVTERRASTSRRSCLMASSFSRSNCWMFRTLPSRGMQGDPDRCLTLRGRQRRDCYIRERPLARHESACRKNVTPSRVRCPRFASALWTLTWVR